MTSDRSGRRGFLRRLALLGGAGTVPLLAGSAPLAAEAAVYNVLDFGARGDGATNDAAAIQSAIDRCSAAGGGTVLLPPGRRFVTGTIELRSFVRFLVEAGAELYASLDPSHYREGTLILATGAANLTLEGRGTIHGQGRRFMREELPHIYRPMPFRPRMMVLTGCRDLRIRDLTLRESALWTVHVAGCEDVVVSGLTILNDRRIPNCDGIGVDSSRNVRISDCHIEAGDDCIVLKTLRQNAHFGACENVTVHGCTLASTSAALKIGTDTAGDVRDVVFSGCVVRDSHRGLAIQLRDEGTVENVLFSDIVVETRHFHEDWWGAAEPIHLSALPRQAGQARVGALRGVRFHNVVCRSENGVVLHGSTQSVPQDVVLEGVKVHLERWTELPGGRLDLRPSPAGVAPQATAGIYARRVRDLSLHRCTVEWGAGPVDARRALDAHDVPGLEVSGLRERRR